MEVRLDEGDEVKAGETITVEAFVEVEVVHVTGTSKGKGFAGVMKRHNFKRWSWRPRFALPPRTWFDRSGATPSRVFKGHKLPGHMGDETVTVATSTS
jgi:large subunit ribosomal protein L3